MLKTISNDWYGLGLQYICENSLFVACGKTIYTKKKLKNNFEYSWAKLFKSLTVDGNEKENFNCVT